MKKMKVIFLDIDGVLINKTCWASCPPFSYQAQADPRCVIALNHITSATAAVIVVSSTWRLSGAAFVSRKLRDWGVTGTLGGITTPRLLVQRGGEIGEWMLAYGHAIDRYVILDDSDDMLGFGRFLVKTDPAVGLTEEDAKSAIAILNRVKDEICI